MSKEDEAVTRNNQKFLTLVEDPKWGVFVRMIEDDMQNLDHISSVDMNQSRDELTREIEVRHHTIISIRQYIQKAIDRAQTAQEDIEDEKDDIINHY